MKTSRRWNAWIWVVVLLALAACSETEVTDEEDTVFVPGEPTWFSLKLGAIQPETLGEIKDATVYLFGGRNAGVLERIIEFSEKDFSKEAKRIEQVTAGTKRILVVANKNKISPNVVEGQTRIEDLLTTQVSLGTTKAPDTSFSVEDVLYSKDRGFLMSNTMNDTQQLYILKEGVSAEDASRASGSNHITLTVRRVAAKVNVQTTGTLNVQPGDVNSAWGTLENMQYSVQNILNTCYLFQNNMDDYWGVVSPLFFQFSDRGSIAEEVKNYYYNNTHSGGTADYLPVTAGSEFYVAENSVRNPLLGNTTFLLIKGTFVWNAGCLITDIAANGDETYKEADYSGDFIYDRTANRAYQADWEGAAELVRKMYLKTNSLLAFYQATSISDALPEGSSEWPKCYYTVDYKIGERRYDIVKSSLSEAGTETRAIVYSTDLEVFVGGEMWYRVNIENHVDATDWNDWRMYSVIRNYAYTITLNMGIAIGSETPDLLSRYADRPASPFRYLIITIGVKPWTVIDLEGNIEI